MNKVDKIPADVFKQYILSSKSVSEVLRKFGANHARYFKYFKLRVQRENIDISHFDGKSTDIVYKKISNEDFFKKGIKYNNSIVKNRYMSVITDYKCNVCHIHNWHDKKLVLHLDHIDGDNTNNLLENLRLLCPNCHSQTETYCRSGDNKIKYSIIKPKYYCSCGNTIARSSKRCRSCVIHDWDSNQTTKIKWPEKNELQNLLKVHSFRALGKILHVSDNAIRKKCKKYGLL